MRFKFVFDEALKKFQISVQHSDIADVILNLENTNQHVYYPLPNDFQKNIRKDIQHIVESEDLTAFIKFEQDIIELRKNKMIELRKKYNMKIMEYCVDYKDKNPEWFI